MRANITVALFAKLKLNHKLHLQVNCSSLSFSCPVCVCSKKCCAQPWLCKYGNKRTRTHTRTRGTHTHTHTHTHTQNTQNKHAHSQTYRVSRSINSDLDMPSGRMRGMAAKHVLNRSIFGFLSPLPKDTQCQAHVSPQPPHITAVKYLLCTN